MDHRPLALCLGLAIAACGAGSHPRTVQRRDARIEAIDRLMLRYSELGQFNGVILVAERGREIYSRAFGQASKELGSANALHTRFAIASITKTFTALLVLRLVDQGKLRLDRTIRDYLPDYPSVAGDKITIAQLLTHTSGMAGDIGDFPPSSNRFEPIVAQINGDFFSLDELIPMIAARPPIAVPGERYSYSSDGYAVLGAIAARVAGKSYEEALRESILAPLGMNDTSYPTQIRLVPDRAAGYSQTFDGYDNARPIAATPAGGMVSTVRDLLRLDRALFGDDILSARSKALVWQLSSSITAYGWKVRKDEHAAARDALFVQASGALPGFNSLFTRTLSDGLLVVALVNTRDMRFRLDDITANVFAILRRQEPPHLPLPSAALRLSRSIREHGLAPAVAEFRAAQVKQPPQHEVVESEINALGYILIGQRRMKEAIAVLTLNVEAFPDSANAYDSLGEAYMTAGERAPAIQNYEKSLARDPKNKNAVDMLERLRRDPP